jgi:multidrug efflux pump subunit AcrB
LLAALIALFSFAFMQLAVAAYACPASAAEEAPRLVATAGEHAGMPGCEGMVDLEQAALCHSHSQVGNQSLGVGVPVLLGDVARVQVGPEMRRGVADLNGEGEVACGVVIMRSGKNALETIAAVKTRLEQLKPSLPPPPPH